MTFRTLQLQSWGGVWLVNICLMHNSRCANYSDVCGLSGVTISNIYIYIYNEQLTHPFLFPQSIPQIWYLQTPATYLRINGCSKKETAPKVNLRGMGWEHKMCLPLLIEMQSMVDCCLYGFGLGWGHKMWLPFVNRYAVKWNWRGWGQPSNGKHGCCSERVDLEGGGLRWKPEEIWVLFPFLLSWVLAIVRLKWDCCRSSLGGWMFVRPLG